MGRYMYTGQGPYCLCHSSTRTIPETGLCKPETVHVDDMDVNVESGKLALPATTQIKLVITIRAVWQINLWNKTLKLSYALRVYVSIYMKI